MSKRSFSFNVGDFAFAKVKGYIPWPATIYAIDKNKYTVKYYGTGQTGTLTIKGLFPYTEYKDKFVDNKSLKRQFFKNGIDDIEADMHKKLKSNHAKRKLKRKDYSQPKTKKPCPASVYVELAPQSATGIAPNSLDIPCSVRKSRCRTSVDAVGLASPSASPSATGIAPRSFGIDCSVKLRRLPLVDAVGLASSSASSSTSPSATGIALSSLDIPCSVGESRRPLVDAVGLASSSASPSGTDIASRSFDITCSVKLPRCRPFYRWLKSLHNDCDITITLQDVRLDVEE